MMNYFTHKLRSKSPVEIVVTILFAAVFISGLAVLFGFVVMWLWNWLMPAIFGLPSLTFWQAAGIIILFKLLFGGFGHGGSKKSSKRSHKSDKSKSKSDFSKWKHYEEFWEEEGEAYYRQYVERQTNPPVANTTDTDSEQAES